MSKLFYLMTFALFAFFANNLCSQNTISQANDEADVVTTVDRTALKALIILSNEEANDAVAGDFAGQYPSDAITAYKEAVGTAQTVYNDSEATQEDVDVALAALKEAQSAFNTAKVSIDFSGVEETIAIAKEAIATATPEKGEGPGTYPESAFTALQQLIDNAQAIIGSTTMNQASVDKLSSDLNNAAAEFYNTRVPNDYTEIEEQLEIALNLYDEAISSGAATAADLETLDDDIQKGLIALNSTSQAEIDRAVKLLKRDIKLYGKYSGIDSVNAALKIAVNGKVLTVSNIPTGVSVSIYSITGCLEKISNGCSSFSLPLNTGFYMIKTDGSSKFSVKVIVR